MDLLQFSLVYCDLLFLDQHFLLMQNIELQLENFKLHAFILYELSRSAY